MIDCIIQARMGSSRLPGKVMMEIDSKHTILDFMINQLEYAKLVDRIIIATSKKAEDDIIETFCKKNTIDCFRGSENDVLDRYYQCAKKFSSKVIVRMPADKPLLDPNVVDQVISEFNNNNYDYITTFLPSTFPSGTEVEIFAFSALEKAWKESVLPSEREHVTPYIHKNPEKFQISNFENDIDLSNFRWAVDEKDDLLFVKKIVSKLNKKPILINDILNVIKNEPKIFEINLNVNRNAGDKKSTKEDIEFLKNREKQNE